MSWLRVPETVSLGEGIEANVKCSCSVHIFSRHNCDFIADVYYIIMIIDLKFLLYQKNTAASQIATGIRKAWIGEGDVMCYHLLATLRPRTI